MQEKISVEENSTVTIVTIKNWVIIRDAAVLEVSPFIFYKCVGVSA